MRTPVSSSAVAPRRLVHRGQVQAAAFLFDMRLLSLAEARERVLSVWTPGVIVYLLPEGLLVTLPTPQTVRADRAPGQPLVARGTTLLTAPLTEDEWNALAPPSDSVVVVRGGVAVSINRHELPTEDPADYLAPVEAAAVNLSSLGEPPAPAGVLLAESNFDPRGALGKVGPPSTEMSSVLEALKAAAERRAQMRPLNASSTPVGEQGIFEKFLNRLFGSRGVGNSGRGAAVGVGGTAGSGLAGAGRTASSFGAPGESWWDRLRRNVARLTALSGLGEIIGRRQAEYLGKMMDLFERGDLHDALRHAIPLSAMTRQEGPPPIPALGVPTPRQDLTISTVLTPARSALLCGPELFEEMRRMYRKAFERLERDGRIEEAAFVLAELLQAHEEAVAFLERHGRIKEAAELAEARNLPPGLLVRLWFLAGETERAVRLARRTGAFADAVLRLERGDEKQRERAQVLRLLWAKDRAEAGDYAAAVETAWSVEEARHILVAWMDRVIEMGGPPAARMLARKLHLLPDQADELRQRMLELLEDDAPETAATRTLLAQELADLGRLSNTSAQATKPTVRVLARAAIRTLGRDERHAEFGGGLADKDLLNHLLTVAGDGALKTDTPPLSPARPVPLRLRTTAREITISPADVGTLTILDAAYLPDGRCLLALGEAGVRLLTRDGRTAAHWPQPTHRLIVADNGTKALMLAPRGEATRLGRLDLATRQCEDWCEAMLAAHAPDYDGSLWFVQSGGDLLAIDTLHPRFASLWRMPLPGGKIRCLARDAKNLCFVLQKVEAHDAWGNPLPQPTVSYELWRHEMPSLILRARDAITPPLPPVATDYTVTPGGYLIRTTYSPSPQPDRIAVAVYPDNIGDSNILPDLIFPGQPVNVQTSPPWIAVSLTTSDGSVVRLLHENSLARRVVFHLGGATQTALRLSATTLTVADDRGRVQVLDLNTGALLTDLRV